MTWGGNYIVVDMWVRVVTQQTDHQMDARVKSYSEFTNKGKSCAFPLSGKLSFIKPNVLNWLVGLGGRLGRLKTLSWLILAEG